jgi:hypothetical protein
MVLWRTRQGELTIDQALDVIASLLREGVSPTTPDTGATLLGPPSAAELAEAPVWRLWDRLRRRAARDSGV